MRKSPTKIEPNQKYGRLTVVDCVGADKHKNKIYECICDCGNVIFVRGNGITSGNTKSCGCYSNEVRRKNRLPNNKGVINQIILGYKRHAKRRNYDWDLSFEEFETLINQPCYYCGTEKSNKKITKHCIDGYEYNGIDRVDSSLGYKKDNVVSCCKICNYAKSNLSQKDFILWAHKVAKYTKAIATQYSEYLTKER